MDRRGPSAAWEGLTDPEAGLDSGKRAFQGRTLKNFRIASTSEGMLYRCG